MLQQNFCGCEALITLQNTVHIRAKGMTDKIPGELNGFLGWLNQAKIKLLECGPA